MLAESLEGRMRFITFSGCVWLSTLHRDVTTGEGFFLLVTSSGVPVPQAARTAIKIIIFF